MLSIKNSFSNYKRILLIIFCIIIFISGTSFCLYRFYLKPLSITYQTGLSLLDEYHYEEAQALFNRLGHYKNSANLDQEISSYLYVDQLVSQNDYVKAIKYLNSIPYTKHVEKRFEQIYQIALTYKEEKNYNQSLAIFLRLKEYKESRQLANELIRLIDERNKVTLVSGYRHFAILTDTGLVHATGDNSSGQCNTGSWYHISKLYAEGNYTVGITDSGTIVTTGDLSPEGKVISTWTNIKELILFPSPKLSKVIGLKKDGTIVSTLPNSPTSSWTNIDHLIGGTDHVIGLKKDGTLVATGSNASGQCNVSSWQAITQVVTGNGYTLGLQKNGTILLAGNILSSDTLTNWSNICYLWSSDTLTVGLQTDGTLIATGSSIFSTTLSSWKNICQLSLNNTGIIGLQLDHSLVSVGLNELSSFEDLCDIHIGHYQFGAIKNDSSLVTKELLSAPTADDFKPKAEPQLGMTHAQVKKSTWGTPEKIITTIDTDGTHEQWIYGTNAIIFLNGNVESIQLEEEVSSKLNSYH